MAPNRPGPRITNPQDDARSDAGVPPATATAAAVAVRNDASKSGGPSVDKRKPAASVAPLPGPSQEIVEGIAWDRMPIQLLQDYRSAHLLRTPSASSHYSGAVLSSGIGKKAPSNRQRQSQDSLASIVRRHFNNQATNEHEVIVNFLYTVKNYDKSFRHRFPPR